MELDIQLTSEVNLNVVFVSVNLGVFEESEKRPSMLAVQNKVNAVFFDNNNPALYYKRLEQIANNKTEVDLYFFYKHMNILPNNYILNLKNEINLLETTISAKIDVMMITDLVYQKFIKLLDDDDFELTPSQINDAKLFSTEIKNKINNKII
jgi:hypothetical protein